MITFKYKVRDKHGKKLTGVVAGENKDQVASRLTEMGYTPIKIIKENEMSGSKIMNRFQFGKLKSVGIFTRQLATLIKSGLTLIRSLETLEKQTDKPYLKEAIGRICSEVEGGIDLHVAMGRHPQLFNKLYTSMVSVGEASGTLDEVLSKLADLIEYEIETRAKIFAVLLYPMLALICMVLGFIVLTMFVLPKIVAIFEGLKGDLPLPTVILLKTNYIMQNYWWLVFGAMIALVIVFLKAIKTKHGRYLWDKFKLKVPLLGTIIFKLIMSRFSRIVAILVRSGVPILDVLDLASQTSGNVIISQSIDKIRDNVRDGKGMAEPMRQAGVFSPMVVQMVAVGEETGRLDDLLYEVSKHYDREASYAISYLATMIEPILIVVLAFGVLIMALGVFMPMWNAYTLIVKSGSGI